MFFRFKLRVMIVEILHFYFFRHILIDIWKQRNTVNVINETRFEKENDYSQTVN